LTLQQVIQSENLYSAPSRSLLEGVPSPDTAKEKWFKRFI